MLSVHISYAPASNRFPLNRGQAMSLKRKPYTGSTRQLVLAFDVGTTYSGISYCILQPGEIPEPRGVTRSLCCRFYHVVLS